MKDIIKETVEAICPICYDKFSNQEKASNHADEYKHYGKYFRREKEAKKEIIKEIMTNKKKAINIHNIQIEGFNLGAFIKYESNEYFIPFSKQELIISFILSIFPLSLFYQRAYKSGCYL